MSSDSNQESIALVTVPGTHAERVREFANTLLEDQSPDVEGYASIIGGIGAGGGPSIGGPIISSLSGTDCSITRRERDFECGDDD